MLPLREERSYLAAGALFLLLNAGADEVSAQPADRIGAPAPDSQEAIIVTGTRLKESDAAAMGVVTVVTAEDIAKTKAVNIEQIIGKLPVIDFTGSNDAGTASGGNGASNAGLRNLGPQRSLVLVDGYRYPFTDVAGSAYDAVDLGNIDIATVDHIDVLRDGASSIYGADAIGGVINIITRQKYSGIEVGGGAGTSTDGGGFQQHFYSLLGTDFSGGNVLVSLSETRQDPVSDLDRAWAVDQHPDAGYNSYPGVSNRVAGMLLPIGGKDYYFGNDGAAGGILASNAAALGHPIDSLGIAYGGGGLAPNDLAIPSRGGVFLNFLPLESLIAGYTKRQASFDVHYSVAPTVQATVQASYTDRQSSEVRQPSLVGNTPTPDFPRLYIAARLPDGSLNPYNPTNPANPAYGIVNPTGSAALTDIKVPIMTRADETGPRYQTQDTKTWRVLAGLDGVLGSFDWKAGYYFSGSDGVFKVANQANFEHYAQELGMLPCDGAVGCSVGNFLGYKTLTPAQAAYLTFTSVEKSRYELQSAYADMTGPVFELPAGPAAVAVGAEFRRDTLTDTPDAVVSSGDAAILNLPTSGSYTTGAGYVEARLPLVKQIPLIETLNATVSARYDENSEFGHDLTYKAALAWRVNPDVQFGGTYGTGFRAPQLRELYGGEALKSVRGSDPCQKNGEFANSEQCLASLALAGATTADVPLVFQLNNVVLGGNRALRPETSSQWLVNSSFTPQAASGFSIDADYYSIRVNHEIGAYDPERLLNACYGNVRYLVTQAEACALTGFADRIAGTGGLSLITAVNGNIGLQTTNGIDLNTAYGFETSALGLPPWGRIDMRVTANRLLTDDISANGTTVQQAGTFSASYAQPRWKALGSLEFSTRNWSLGWTTRFYGGFRNQDPTSACEYGTVACAGNVFNFPGNIAPGQFLHDVQSTYHDDQLFVSIGVDNVFDKSPPFIVPGSPGVTLGAAGYDLIGRFVYLRASYKL
jgi:outer membrane receptor protein involved in Fe transport